MLLITTKTVFRTFFHEVNEEKVEDKRRQNIFRKTPRNAPLSSEKQISFSVIQIYFTEKSMRFCRL